MPTTPLPGHLTKVSYILPKTKKTKLEAIAKRKGVSMSAVITDALADVLKVKKQRAGRRGAV